MNKNDKINSALQVHPFVVVHGWHRLLIFPLCAIVFNVTINGREDY